MDSSMQPLELPAGFRDILVQNTQRVLIGVFLNCMLFGVLAVQVYLYWISFPSDRWFTKAIVYAIVVLEAVQTIIVISDPFNTLARGFGNPASANEVGLSWFSIPAMCGWIAFMVQGVYGYRIYVLSKSKIIYTIILMLATFQFGGALVVAFEAKNSGVITGILGSKQTLVTAGIWEGSSAICDIIIAVGMTYHLKIRDRGTNRTHELLTRIVRLSIGTGTVTATLALVTLVLAYLPSHQSFWITVVMIIGKAYANSVMVALNSRLNVTHNSSYPLWQDKKNNSAANFNRSRGIIFARTDLSSTLEESQSGAESKVLIM